MTSEEDIQRKIVFEAIRMVKSGILKVLEVKDKASYAGLKNIDDINFFPAFMTSIVGTLEYFLPNQQEAL
jgi:hypothetical protein